MKTHDLALLGALRIRGLELDHLTLSEAGSRNARRVQGEGQFLKMRKRSRHLEVWVMATVVRDAAEPVELWESDLSDVMVEVRELA